MRFAFLLAIAAMIISGCDSATPTTPETTPENQAAENQSDRQGISEQPGTAVAPAPLPTTETPSEPATPESVPAATPPVAVEAVPLEPGFTGKGQYDQGDGEKVTDIITVPIGQFFSIKERIVLNQLQHTETCTRP